MDDPGALDDNFDRCCEICGTALTIEEIADAREHGRPFACSSHAADVLPADELAREGDEAPP